MRNINLRSQKNSDKPAIIINLAYKNGQFNLYNEASTQEPQSNKIFLSKELLQIQDVQEKQQGVSRIDMNQKQIQQQQNIMMEMIKQKKLMQTQSSQIQQQQHLQKQVYQTQQSFEKNDSSSSISEQEDQELVGIDDEENFSQDQYQFKKEYEGDSDVQILPFENDDDDESYQEIMDDYIDQDENKKYSPLIPVSCNWFDLNSIHQQEINYFPEFFDNSKPSKTPEIYLKYRNFIINVYRRNPRQYLSGITCRRNLAGDVNGILKVHKFLEKQGLINCIIDPSSKKQDIIQIDKRGKQNQSIVKFKKCNVDIEQKINTSNNQMQNFELIFNCIKILSKNIRPYCSNCNQICGLSWFQNRSQDEQDVYLCMDCKNLNPNQVQNSSKFQSARNKEDIKDLKNFEIYNILKRFEKNQKQLNTIPWTADETTKLLKKLSQSQDAEREIVMEFNRSKEDILLHLLQLPFQPIRNDQIINNLQQENYQGIANLSQQNNNDNILFQQIVTTLEPLSHIKQIDIKLEQTNSKFDIQTIDQLAEKIGITIKDIDGYFADNQNNSLQRAHMSILLQIQFHKIEQNLKFFENYEQEIWNQKQQLQIYQKQQFIQVVKQAYASQQIDQNNEFNCKNNNLNQNQAFSQETC